MSSEDGALNGQMVLCAAVTCFGRAKKDATLGEVSVSGLKKLSLVSALIPI